MQYFEWSLGLSSLITILTAINIIVNNRHSGLKKITTIGRVVVVLIIITCIFNYKQHSIDLAEKRSSDSTNVARYDSVLALLQSSKHSLLLINQDVTYIKAALSNRGLKWDSIGKTIVQKNFQINMPNTDIRGGNNQFGNGNTQNN